MRPCSATRLELAPGLWVVRLRRPFRSRSLSQRGFRSVARARALELDRLLAQARGLSGGPRLRFACRTRCRACRTRLLIALVHGYRLLLRPWLGNACRFEPTCSAYALQALRTAWRAAGTYLGACRDRALPALVPAAAATGAATVRRAFSAHSGSARHRAVPLRNHEPP